MKFAQLGIIAKEFVLGENHRHFVRVFPLHQINLDNPVRFLQSVSGLHRCSFQPVAQTFVVERVRRVGRQRIGPTKKKVKLLGTSLNRIDKMHVVGVDEDVLVKIRCHDELKIRQS